MLMALVMCLTLLPVSTLAATLNGEPVTELGTGSASTTLTNGCDAAVKYSITLGSSAAQEVTLGAHASLIMKGTLGENYSVTWVEGTDPNYVYEEPADKTLTGTIGQVTTTRYYYKNSANGTECTNEVANTVSYDGHTMATEGNVYYDVTSLVTFERTKGDWGIGFVYTNVANENDSYSGINDENAYNKVYNAYPTCDHTRAVDGLLVPNESYMFMYKTVEPRTETVEGDANVTFTATVIESGTEGTFKVAALNVDGMPQSVDITVLGQSVKSLNLNDDGPKESGSALIGQYIEKSGIDFLALSEDFNYYSQIEDNAPSYTTGTQRLQDGIPTKVSVMSALTAIKFPLDTDGLNLMYKKNLTVTGETMVSWTDHYSPTTFYGIGNLGIDVPDQNGADGMIDKGYRFYQVKVAEGVVVDVYILHMDAETDPEDNAARANQIKQLMAAVDANDNGNPIIIMGDTNCRYTRDPLYSEIISRDFSDPWVEFTQGDIYPEQNNIDVPGEVVDKVFYRNAEGSNLQIKAKSYTWDNKDYTNNGVALGDHNPVIVEFEYTLKSSNQQHVCTPVSAWTGDGSGHWHECSDPDCPIKINSEKPGYAAHSYGDYTVDSEPTCTEPGTKTRTCSECGYEDSRTIPALGHDWGEGVVTTEPTTTSTGVMTYTCNRCPATRTEVIPMLEAEYTFTLNFDKESYNVGDTATATIFLSKKDGTGSVGEIGFKLDVPAYLQLTKLENELPETGSTSIDAGNYGYNVTSDTGIAVGTDNVLLATATFTVTGGFNTDTAEVTLGLGHHEVTVIDENIPRGSDVTTDSATLVKSYTVNLVKGEHTSFEGADTITVTAGTTFGELTLPEVTVDQYYDFDGWYNNDIKMTPDTLVTGGMILTAKATPETYTFTQPTVDNATIGNLTGVTSGKATYGTDITFTVTPDESYAVTGVTYTVDGGEAQKLTAVDGTYTIPGTDITGAVTVNVTTVYYHTITFQAGTGVDMTSATAVVKDGLPGYYTDTTFAQQFTLPTPTEKDGYRLADEPLWSGSNGTKYTTSDLSSATFNSDVTLTAQAVKTWTITFQAGAHTTVTDTQVTVDDGATFGSVTKPSYTVAEHYTPVGWYNGNDKMDDSDTIHSDLTLTATAVATSYDFSETSDNATVTVSSGVINGKATYGTDIKFTVSPASGYAVTGVSYTVGTGTAATPLTAENGTYTIDGENITGTIKVEVVAVQYYKITFQAGTGTTMDRVTAYVKDGETTLYTGTDFENTFTVPSPNADDGYRLAKDNADEPLWSDGANNKYQSSALGSTVQFTADTVLTAQAVKQWTVTFQAGTNGSFAEDAVTKLTVDANHVLASTEIPAVTAEAGYQFNGWSSDVNAAITADTTFTAQYTDATYTLTLPTIPGVTFTVTGATSNDNGTYTVTHGQNVTIGVAVDETQVDVDSVTYTIGEGTTGTTVDISDVPFTIQGGDITDNVNLTVDSTAVYAITVEVVNGLGGTVNGETTSSTVYLNKDTPAETVKAAFTFVAEDGYEFVAPAFTEVTGPATYTVEFTPIEYEITVIWDDDQGNGFDYKHPDEDATCTEDLDFTPDMSKDDPTELVFAVWYHVGEIDAADGEPVEDGDWDDFTDADDAKLEALGWTEIQPDANGQFVIPEEAITGPVTIYYGTIDTTDPTHEGSFEFITEETYMAAPQGKQVAVLTTGKLTSGTYTLDGYGAMFWSSKYNAYVCFVADTETEDTLPWKLSKSGNTATEIDYTGDINGVGGVTPADSAPINAVLHNINVKYDITDLMRFQFDVLGDKKVDTQDIMWILNTYTHASNT